MAEREYFDQEDWLTSGGDPTYGQAVSTPQPTMPTAPQTQAWTDPDNAPPPWLHDPNADMSGHPLPPGLRWAFLDGMWRTIQSQRASNPQTPTGPGGPPTSPPPPGPRGLLDGDGFGSEMAEWGGYRNWPSYQQPGFVDPGTFDPGPQFTYKDFVSPSADSMLQEPGFQFRLDQGRKALESSAAGKGILRSGGTLKDILGYGQNFASQEYGNVWNRALNEYDTNRTNALDQWQAQYGQRKDKFGFGADRANNMNAFNVNNAQFGFNANQRQAELDAREAFDRWAKSGDWMRDIVGFGAD